MKALVRHAGWIGLLTILPQLWLATGSHWAPAQLRAAGLLLLANILLALALALLLDRPTRRLPLLGRPALRPLLPAFLLALPQALLIAHTHVADHKIGGATRDLIYGFSALLALVIAALACGLVARTPKLLPERMLAGSVIAAAAAIMVGFFMPSEPRPSPREGSPNILVIVLDALRPDALGCYGSDFPTSPHLDAMAAEGVVFENAFSSSSSSVPGHTSLLWGLDVAEHGAPSNRHDLPPGMPPSLADRMRDRGYRSFGICQNPLINAVAGFAQGFDYYWSWSEAGLGDAPWQESLLSLPAVELAIKLSSVEPISLRASKHFGSGQPWFGFVQYLYTHDPYIDGDRWVSPERVAEIRRRLQDGAIRNSSDYTHDEIAGFIAKYYGSVAYSDRLVRDLLAQLDPEVRENTVLILTSDHGETLAEHGHEGVGKHFGYHNASLRIPLLIHDPRNPEAARVPDLTGLDRVADIALAYADGEDPLLAARKDRHLMFSDPFLVAVNDSLKVVLNGESLEDGPAVYRWQEDAYDEHPLTHDSLATVVELTEALLESWEKIEPVLRPEAEEDMRPEKLERLKALGYVE